MDDQRVFFVTGGASGIGRHVAGTLIQRGQQVAVADIEFDKLLRQAEEDGWRSERVRLVRLDIRDPAQWENALDEAWSAFGRVDVLMNIAGYLKPGHGHASPVEEVHRHFDINAKGVTFGSQAAARRMLAQGHGHIVNIASMASLFPVPGLTLYSASKYAVRALSLAMAQELRPHNVFVTVVCPDPVQTPMLELQKGYQEAAMTFAAPHYLTVEEVGKVLLGPVLRRKPLQVVIPPRRGWLAHVGNLLPSLAPVMIPMMQKAGLSRLAKIRGTKGS